MEPTSPEYTELPKPPLTIRFHHLNQLEGIEDFSALYQRDAAVKTPGRGVRIISFVDLWQHPDLVDRMIDRYTPSYLRPLSIAAEDKEESEYAKDFLGENGDMKEQFLAADRAVIKRILKAAPDERFSITWGPDLMCHACPRNGPDKPGDHCILPSTATEDARYYEDIEKMRTSKVVPKEIRKDIKESFDGSGRHTFNISANTLRSDDFYTRATERMYESPGTTKQEAALLEYLKFRG